mmetsp:Transcript_108226/g.170618  ORF Transcript_108226/g.170618 Transcript_108226/m.170618 type:complete len:181 (-) Transcript_108226:302-844(-)
MAKVEKRKADFEEKFVAELAKVRDPESRFKKFLRIKEMMSRKSFDLKKVGLDETWLKNLVTKLGRQFLKRLSAGEHDVFEKQEQLSVSALTHRHMPPPAKSSLKTQRSQNKRLRVQYSPYTTEVAVTNFKSEIGLWFPRCIDASVICDRCNKIVPKEQGALQGAVGRSKFSLSYFACVHC